jgi:hypothetical protein
MDQRRDTDSIVCTGPRGALIAVIGSRNIAGLATKSRGNAVEVCWRRPEVEIGFGRSLPDAALECLG